MADDLRRPVAPDLYDADFYAWAQAQAALIQSLGKEGRLPPDLDWARLAEEVGDLGKSDLRGAESLVRNIIVHLALIEAGTREEPKRHWRAEILAFQQDLRAYLTPSIRRKLQDSLETLHQDGLSLATAKLAAQEPGVEPPSPTLHWPLDTLLGKPTSLT